MAPQIEVVAAAIVRDRRLLLAQRVAPPEFAGLWELPGGKVEPGETPAEAMRRELTEELGVAGQLVRRIGVDVPLPRGYVLRAYVTEIDGEPRPLHHSALTWVGAAQLRGADLVPNDRAWLDDLELLLR